MFHPGKESNVISSEIDMFPCIISTKINQSQEFALLLVSMKFTILEIFI